MLRNKQVLIAAIAGLALQGYAAFALADDDDGVKVVATGFLSPRGLDFAPNGQLYVAEAGTQVAATSDPAPPCTTYGMGGCYTNTGVVSRIDLYKDAAHARAPVLTGLPTLGDVGPADISFFGFEAYVVIGLGSDPLARGQLTGLGAAKAATLGSVIRFNPYARGYHTAADISEFERSYNNGTGNPDGGLTCSISVPRGSPCTGTMVASIDTNPFGITARPGRLIVADAGGNDLIEVSANGKKRLLAVFPNEGNGERVPSRVVEGPDGYLYVGEEAFSSGSNARIYRCNPNGGCETYAEGFTTVMDLEFDRSGHLYVLEYLPGDLLKIDDNGKGTRTQVKTGLSAPGGLALSDDAAYVSNKATSYGGADGKGEYGEVLRIPLDNGHRHGHHGKD